MVRKAIDGKILFESSTGQRRVQKRVSSANLIWVRRTESWAYLKSLAFWSGTESESRSTITGEHPASLSWVSWSTFSGDLSAGIWISWGSSGGETLISDSKVVCPSIVGFNDLSRNWIKMEISGEESLKRWVVFYSQLEEPRRQLKERETLRQFEASLWRGRKVEEDTRGKFLFFCFSDAFL